MLGLTFTGSESRKGLTLKKVLTMKRYIITGLLLLSLVFVPALFAGWFGGSDSSNSASSSNQAPTFTLPDMNGKLVGLEDYRGKYVFLNFWATWCPPCRTEMPSMERLYEFLPADDFVMLAVNVEPNGKESVGKFLKDHPHSFPILLDTNGMVQRQYGVFQFPETFVIDRNGQIVDRVVGARDWSSIEAIQYFSKLIKK